MWIAYNRVIIPNQCLYIRWYVYGLDPRRVVLYQEMTLHIVEYEQFFPMTITRRSHKLTYDTPRKRDVWSSHCEIIQLSTNRLYLSWLLSFCPCPGSNLTFGSIGVSVALHPIILVSSRMSKAYFLWELRIPYLEWTTSIPRKYFSLPRSLVWKCWKRYCFKLAIPTWSLTVIMISST